MSKSRAVTITNCQTRFPISQSKLKSVVQKACAQLKVNAYDISLMFCSPNRMRSINNRFLKHDYVTDVITFDYTINQRFSEKMVHGEIVICPWMAHKQAKEFDTVYQHEMMLYVVHGILHLCGYDDHKPQDIARMRRREKQIMARCV